MDRYQETFETWNKLASLYQSKFMDLDLYNESYDLFCAAIEKENAKILDLGCGPGNITKYLISKRPDFVVHGIDVAPQMVELAKINNPTATFEVLDARHLQKLKLKFDAIICGFALPYLSEKDCKKLFRDCNNTLQDNGFLYVSFVEGDPVKSDFKTANTIGRAYFHYHRLKEVMTQLKENNFGEFATLNVTYRRTETETEVHCIVLARKSVC